MTAQSDRTLWGAGRTDTATLFTWSNLSDLDALGARNIRRCIAEATTGFPPSPLLPGTDVYTENWVSKWHSGSQGHSALEVSCYSVSDAVVSGDGQIWIADHLITSQEVMPIYVSRGFDLEVGAAAPLQRVRRLPIRTVTAPCLVAVGHGARVYGHFLTEMMFRVLVAKKAFAKEGLRYRVLLQADTPSWLIYILNCYFDVRFDEMEFYNPETERILLKEAIISGRVLQDEGFHPVANVLLEEFLETVSLPDLPHKSRRFFVQRNGYVNTAAPKRICVNERKLAEIAMQEHGFLPVTIEHMEWLEQIALFKNAEIIIGQAGSGLHNALFSGFGSKLASIGIMNYMQMRIGALRHQQMAYLTKGFNLKGDFQVDEDSFRGFLECAF